MKKNLLTICLFFMAGLLNAQTSEFLKIGDVQDSWTTYPGSIDKATIFINPRGLYAECQMLLDFSVKCTPFTDPNDSLEIQMNFNLPANAEVVDLWLWVGNIPVRAGIYDKWSASQIYEDIVDRRQDPALLVKNSSTNYALKIFPLMVNMPRKIKMTFLLPFNKLTGSQTFVTLPFNILKLSKCTPDTVCIGYKPGLNLINPTLFQFPQNTFVPQSDSLFGQYMATYLTNSSSTSTLVLSLNSTVPQNTFLGRYQVPGSNNGIYQLELNLAQLLGVQQHKKTLFLMDFLSINSSLSKTQVLQVLKSYLLNSFEAGDSINFMFSDLFINPMSNTWISADSAMLNQTLNAMDTNLIKSFSNLPSLLSDGINFIKSHGNDGNIIVISSSSGFTNSNDANSLLNNTLTLMGSPKFPIHTIYLDDKSYINYYSNSYYRGNEYFFSNLSMLTGGEFQTIVSYSYSYDWWWYYYEATYTSFDEMLGNILPKLTGYFTALNVYTTLQSGFTYADYSFSSINGFTYFGSPYRRVGKFTGSFPMNIQVSAQTPDGQLYNTQLVMDTAGIFSLDSVSKNIWAANRLREMFSFDQTNSVVYQIVQTSISERVLTDYTAFLALEPGMNPPDTVAIPNMTSPTGFTGNIVSTPDQVSAATRFSCFPNPVKEMLFFEFETEKSSSLLVELYTIQGRQVAIIAEGNYKGGQHKLSYNTVNLSDGVYFYRVRIDGKDCYSGKVIVAK